MKESDIEWALCRAVQARGGMAMKFVSPGLSGVPDRIVLMPGGHAAFVELKAPGGHLRPLQEKRKKQLEALEFLVYCINDPKQIGGMLDAVCAT